MFIKELKKYDGKLLHDRFAYTYFKSNCNALGDIILFRGEMQVLADFMIDKEDLQNQAFIFSDDAINILWELPVLGNNLFGAVAYQQLFNQKISQILADQAFLNQPVIMQGDDMMIQTEDVTLKKMSVSITHIKNHAALGHTGINIKAGSKAPPVAYSTNMSDGQIAAFVSKVEKLFYTLNQQLFCATAKIIN